jgi:hypothetical protein
MYGSWKRSVMFENVQAPALFLNAPTITDPAGRNRNARA